MDKLLRSGRHIFALSMGIFGVQHFVYAHSIPTPGLVDIPPYTSQGPVGAYLIGAGLVAASLSVASGKSARRAGCLLGGLLFLDFLVVHSPRILAHPQSGNLRTRGFETLAMAATALVLAAGLPANVPDFRGSPFSTRTMAQVGRFLFAASLAIFGVQHFMYHDFIASLIPAWIPGRLFLTYFTGVGFLATALSIASAKLTRLTGIMLAAMFFTWVSVLHAPRVFQALHNGNEWASMLVAVTMGAAGLIFAGVFHKESDLFRRIELS
jgi:uncharacterized membrane protein